MVALPEGHDPKFLLTEGWLSPGLNKFSMSRAYPTWLMPKKKQYTLDTNQNGEDRAFVVSGQYEAVFPFDIYPVHLIKSIMVNDIDAMEKARHLRSGPRGLRVVRVCVHLENSCSIHRARRFGRFESGTRLIQSEQNARIRLR